MGKMKKILAAGVVCYVAYKLGQKYLKENNLTAEDVFDSAKKKAEAFAKQAAGVVPTTKDGEPEGKKIYTFGKEKRIEMVHLADGVTGLYDNKKNYPIEKQVKIYSEDGGKLYVYSDAADYVISDEPFFMNVYVKDKDKTEAIAIALGKQYDAEEIAVYNRQKPKPKKRNWRLRQQQPKRKPLRKKLQKMLRPLRTKPKK